jgi:hypothetical protein
VLFRTVIIDLDAAAYDFSGQHHPDEKNHFSHTAASFLQPSFHITDHIFLFELCPRLDNHRWNVATDRGYVDILNLSLAGTGEAEGFDRVNYEASAPG